VAGAVRKVCRTLSTFYHGTGIEYEESVRRDGLREGPKSRSNGNLSGSYPGIYLTPSRDVASNYASYRAYMALGLRLQSATKACKAGEVTADELQKELTAYHGARNAGVEGLLLTVELPDDCVFMIDDTDHWGFCCNVPLIPSTFITRYERVPFDPAALQIFRTGASYIIPMPDDRRRGRFVGGRFVLDVMATA
jgi:hypothetical protein